MSCFHQPISTFQLHTLCIQHTTSRTLAIHLASANHNEVWRHTTLETSNEWCAPSQVGHVLTLLSLEKSKERTACNRRFLLLGLQLCWHARLIRAPSCSPLTMPRVKFPPTPATSTGPSAQEKVSDMENSFVLPPAAVNHSPPASPIVQRKRTLSGSTKGKEELPPPPSRARKIIQMKPKEERPSVPSTAKPTSPKKKQQSTTSAAGRRIARKTAHSVIERRRRSKMNEEFGVLKDMIPACNGVEMHKLAILQAGIEYVKYLQGCVEKLQDDRGSALRQEEEDDEETEEQGAGLRASSASPAPQPASNRRTSTATASTATTSTRPSPLLQPSMSSSSLASQRQLPPPMTKSKTYSTSPPPVIAQTPTATGISPAFNAIHFSPDLSRIYSNQQHQHLGKYSPNIHPLPQAAMPMGATAVQEVQEGHAEATATAALMMLTNDRRAMGGSGRGGGMSVRDLLSH